MVLAKWTDGKWLVERGLVRPVQATFTPSVGVVVSQDNGGDGTPAKATGLVRAAGVRQRLERFLEGVDETAVELSEKAKKAQYGRVAKIAARAREKAGPPAGQGKPDSVGRSKIGQGEGKPDASVQNDKGQNNEANAR